MEGPKSAPWESLCPSLLEDWLTIWHSELAAMLGDRELQEARLRGLDAWAAQARAVLRASAPFEPPDGAGPTPSGSTGPVPPPGPEAIAAAPDARDAELARHVERLSARVAELERKLAGG